MSNKLILISILFLFHSCSSKKQTQELANENPKPNWALSKPIDASYYYGIGTVNMNVHTSNYQQIAKNKALEDLASEIEVSVDAQSVLRQKESNQSFIENYQATTRIDVNNNLSDFESVDSWLNENEYWVLYRLSKADYKQREAEKRSQAINKSLHFLDLAENESDYKTHLDYLLQSIDAIKAYLNDPLKSERNNQQIYLGNYVLTRITDKLNMLDLIPSSDDVVLTWANCFDKDLSFAAQHEDIPIENIPIRIQFNSYSAKQIISDQNGIVIYKCASNFYEETPPEIRAWIKTSDLIKDPMVASLYNSEYASTAIKIEVEKPQVYIETENGKGIFQEKIEKAGAKVSPNKESYDIRIETQFNTNAKGVNNDFYTMACSLQLNVYNTDGTLIEQKIWPEAKGVHTNEISAKNKAIENALKQIKYTWIQKLIMEHCPN